jgi:hypothetical protein
MRAAATGVGLIALVAGACAKGTEREPAVVTTTSVSANESAAQSIAAARCDREEKCANVGSGKMYASRNACVDELRDKTQSELHASKCDGDVDKTQLEACLTEIRAEKCKLALDMISRVAGCRPGSLCVR